MTQLEFTVYAVPVAQPRQKQRIFRSKAGPLVVGNYIDAHDPVNEYKYILKQTAKELTNNEPLWDGPIGMNLEVYLPRPKKFDNKKYGTAALWHVSRKDIDNLFKSVADSLTGIVYRDDGQICNATIQKFYHERAGVPRVYIKIWKME